MGKPAENPIPPDCLEAMAELFDAMEFAREEMERSKETANDMKKVHDEARSRFLAFVRDVRKPNPLFEAGRD